MATSQHRCVFVGNIPYDASEEQLIQICEEVGPVVSFRLVTDRETGKPKGYGFCEYKDEETALSARRNLQGYEINGRQLRVDFAENDKNSDRNRDQGRGGPGMATNVDPAKQLGGPSSVGSSNFHQPIGLEVAMNAAAVMAGALGGSQSSRELNRNGFQGQQTSYNDPLTLHLAKMSRNQLNEVMSELKVMSSQKKELARQLLLSSPHLSKALFQSQIMLGMVTQQMLQMPNIRQTSGPLAQLSSQDGLQGQHPVVHTSSGLPPLAHNKVQLGLMPREHEAQLFSLHPNSLSLNQYSAVPHLPIQPRAQLPQQSQNQVLEQSISGISTFPSTRPPHLGGVTTRPQSLVATSSPVNQQMQLPLLQHLGQTGANLVQNIQLVAPTSTLQARPLLSDQRFQPGTSMRSGIPPDLTDKVADRPAQFINASTWANSVDPYSSFPPGSSEKANMVHDTFDPMGRPSKLLKLDDGRSTSSAVGVNVSTSIPGPSQVSGPGLFGNRVPKAEEASNSEKQVTQLPADVDPTLLEQVLSLTPEQLSSLPPDQQQQVFQLQQMLR